MKGSMPRRSTALLRRTAVRATAIGVVLGLAAAGETVRLTPGLARRPGAALPLAGMMLLPFCAAAWGGAAALGLADLTSRRLGARPGALLSGRLLWGIALAASAWTALDETSRSVELGPWKGALRGAILLALGVVLLHTLAARPHPPRWTARLEGALALLLLPGALLAAAYFLQAPPRGGGGAGGGRILARPPEFLPESPPIPQAHGWRGTGGGTGGGAGGVPPARTRVLVIGLDGAAWPWIRRGIQEGRLPAFARVLGGGASSELATLLPTRSPSIWTTVVTGVPPAKHGIEDFYLYQIPRLGLERVRIRRGFDLAEDFLDRLGELERVPVTSAMREAKAVWNLADEAGLTSVVVGLWATWPPERLAHGFVVSDHASRARLEEWRGRGLLSRPGAGAPTHPASLAARLADLQRTPESVTRAEIARFLPVSDQEWRTFRATRIVTKRVPLSIFRSAQLNDEFHLAAALRLWREERPDLCIVYARLLDDMGHFFLRPRRALRPDDPGPGGVMDRAYDWMDEAIAPLVEEVEADPEALLVLLSDHGWAREPDGRFGHGHAPPGILVLHGAGVRRGAVPERPSVYDIAPTILERLRLPLSRELRGRPLVEAFLDPHPLRRVAPYRGRRRGPRGLAPPMDPAEQRRLRALGYLDR